MSALEPSGPAQPSLDQVYETSGNAASKEPAQENTSAANAQAPSGQDQRIPTQQTSGIEDATASSLGRGVHGAPPGEEVHGETSSQDIQRRELDGQQMRASGEGDVADIVDSKPGATGAEDDLASDLDRKKAEQAPMRTTIQEERKENVDVGGILGQRGGPANPVDKNSYPNA